jgi:uncharacterized protein
MGALVPYSIPIQGLKIGIHRYNYHLDRDFFRHFEDAPFENADIGVTLQIEKRSDMFLLDFVLQGTVDAICDRCTAAIHLPVGDERQLVVKYGESEGLVDDDEVLFISRDAWELNVAPYLYEFTVLALPMTNTYDCESEAEPPCNQDILQLLKPAAEVEDTTASVWEVLKKDFTEVKPSSTNNKI